MLVLLSTSPSTANNTFRPLKGKRKGEGDVREKRIRWRGGEGYRRGVGGEGGVVEGSQAYKRGWARSNAPLFLGHFVKDFTKDFFLLDIGPPQSGPPTFEFSVRPWEGLWRGKEGVVEGKEGW